MRKKRKLTAAEKAEKKRRRQEFETISIGGKMKRVRRPPSIDGMDPEELILRNADPIWLHQNEMWGYIQEEQPLPEGGPTSTSVPATDKRNSYER